MAIKMTSAIMTIMMIKTDIRFFHSEIEKESTGF